jgi:hypothetical protein
MSGKELAPQPTVDASAVLKNLNAEAQAIYVPENIPEEFKERFWMLRAHIEEALAFRSQSQPTDANGLLPCPTLPAGFMESCMCGVEDREHGFSFRCVDWPNDCWCGSRAAVSKLSTAGGIVSYQAQCNVDNCWSGPVRSTDR